MKLDLLTNATVVDDAIRFVSHKSQDKQNHSDNLKRCAPAVPTIANILPCGLV
jgi:hypothetical protein